LLATIGERTLTFSGERHLVEAAKPQNAGVVDEDIESAQGGDGLVDRGFDGGDIGAVGLDRHGFPSRGLDGVDDLRGAICGLFVSDGDIGAFRGERSCDGRADTPACARHQGPFSCQRHDLLLFCIDRHRISGILIARVK
jgi:hypothetical protein